MRRMLGVRILPALTVSLLAGLLGSLLGGLLVLPGCAQRQPGPVQPLAGPRTPGVLVLDDELQPWLDVPAGQQNYSYNSAGLLEYNTVVRNRGSQVMALAYNADFWDDSDRLLESQDPVRFFVEPQGEKPLQIAANHRGARKMRIQIRPAR